MFSSSTLLARRAASVSSSVMGATRLASSVPARTVLGAGGAQLDTSELFKGKSVLVGVVGAFTGTCDAQVPTLAARAEEFKAKGVDKVVVMTVNDPVVVNAWKKSLAIDSQIDFIADFDASLTKELGQDIDLSAAGFGVRSNRFAMVIEDGNIVSTVVEESPGDLEVTSAATILASL